jgi:two-component system, cell cycle sensor histidine kinase and response regulator CckA
MIVSHVSHQGTVGGACGVRVLYWGVTMLFRFMMALLCLGAVAAAESGRDGYVVWLHSYHPAEWSDALLRGIRSGLGPGQPLRIEFMDAKRRNDAPYLAALGEMLRLKHAGHPVRAVIASDDDAARFAVAHRDDLFGGAQVAWCGVNRFEPSLLADGRASGVIEEVDAVGTLDLAFRLRPEARSIHVICDDTGASRDNLAALQAILTRDHSDRRVELVRDLPLASLAAHLASLPAEDVAFFVSFWRDGDGHPVEPDQLVPALRASACPVLGRSEWMIGRGQLGGLCVSGEVHGRVAAGIAVRLIAGESAADIPVTTAANAWVFDAVELARHGIAEADLPAGAEVRFRPASVLRDHPWHVAVTVAVVAVLVAFSVALGIAMLRRRRAERALAAERSVLAALLDQSMHVMGILDISGRVLLVNQSALDVVGSDAANQIGLPFWETLWWTHDPAQAEWLRQAVASVVAGGQTVRRLVTYRGRDGNMHSIDFSLKLARLPDGTMRLVSEGRDVSELIETRDRLAESEMRFRQLAEHIDAVFWLLDRPAGRILYVSRAYARIWGRDPAELIDRPAAWLDAIHPEDRPAVEHAMATAGPGAWEAQFRIIRPDGGVRRIRQRAYPVASIPGRVAGIAEDETELHRLAGEARQAQRLQLLRQLAGGVAHDFNNALAGIVGNAELALVDPGLPAGAHHRLRVIASTAARAGTTTRQLLTFARTDAPERRRFDLMQVVGDAVTLGRPAMPSGITLDWQTGTPLEVDGDPGLVQNAVLNLLLNARDAVADQERPGSITVRCGVRPVDGSDPDLATWRLSPGAYAMVSVQDNGVGIAAAVREHIFEPFFTTKATGMGSGLGLAAVHGTASDHGGAVQVTSEPGAGATFSLLLPVAPVEPAASGAAEAQAVILVADDEPVVREITAQLLATMGYEAVMACDGAEAVARVASGGIDLVILDMVMPNMDGREAMKRIHALAPRLPVLLLTGWAETGGEELMQAGAYAVLGKPLTVGELSHQVKAALGRT